MNYSHLSIIDRGQLEILNRLGWSARAIARHLGRHHSTIAREIKRGFVNQTYEAKSSHQASQDRRRESKPRGKFPSQLAEELQTDNSFSLGLVNFPRLPFLSPDCLLLPLRQHSWSLTRRRRLEK